MKSSGWSSRATWVCSAGCALALAAPAAAGVDVSPQRIDPGDTARIVFWVPNDGKTPITGVAIVRADRSRVGCARTTRTCAW